MLRILFSTNGAWYSRLIRWFTWSEFSHVDIFLDDDTVFGCLPEGGSKATSFRGLGSFDQGG